MKNIDLKYDYFLDRMLTGLSNGSENVTTESIIDDMMLRMEVETLFEKQSAVERTSFIETCSAIGIVASKNQMKQMSEFLNFVQRISKALHTPMSTKQIEKLQEMGKAYRSLTSKVLKSVKSILNAKFDWDSKGKQLCLELEPEIEDVDEIVDLCAIARGMYKFVESIVRGKAKMSGKLYFIHNKINDYYQREKEVLGEIEGSKANTADMVISTASAENTLKYMRQGVPRPNKGKNPSWVEVMDGKKELCRYVQASLKISETGGQLGKVGDKMSAMGLKPVLAKGGAQALAGELKESTFELANEMGIFYELNLKQLWQNAKTVFGEVWENLKKAVKKVAGFFTKKWVSIFKKDRPPKKMIFDFAQDVGVTNITESEIDEMMSGNILTEGKINPKTREYLDKIIARGTRAIDVVNNEKKTLQQLMKNQPKSIVGEFGPDLKKRKFKWDEKTTKLSKGQIKPGESKKDAYSRIQVLHLVGNYCTLKTLQTMIHDSKKVIEVIRSLTAEMIFGGTQLPLYKVFGDYENTNKPWNWIGTVKHFVKQGTEISKKQMEILGIKVSPHQDHYTIYVHMLLELEDEKKCYALFRTGPNSSSSFTYNFEGQSKYCIAPGEKIDLTKER